MTRRTHVLLVGMVVAALAGCGRRETATSAADRDVAARIRQSLAADTTLSPGAKNVSIEANAGSVTLRGSVASDAERAAVGATAQQAAGDRSIDNELVVASRRRRHHGTEDT